MIGVLTFHYSYNEGAILQAFALVEALRKAGANEVEIVDHRYRSKLDIYNKGLDPRKKKLADAIDTWLPLSPKRFVTNDEQPTWEYLSSRYRGIVVGSDQVWRVKYSRACFGLKILQRDPFVGKFPNVYWPPRSLKVDKFSYAASVGDANLGPIPRKDRLAMTRILDDFKILGVRDARTADFLVSLASSLQDRIEFCPDPTWLIPWEAILKNERIDESLSEVLGSRANDRLCLLGLDSSLFAHEVACALAQEGFLTVGYGSWDNYSHIRAARWGLTPLQWVSLFKKVSLCVTDRMHAFIFSMLAHCPCIVIDRHPGGEKRCTRISDLQERLGYDYVVGAFHGAEAIVDIVRNLSIDWAAIDSRIAVLRNNGLAVVERIAQL